jgi:uncharacterized protein VirK/YbjX
MSKPANFAAIEDTHGRPGAGARAHAASRMWARASFVSLFFNALCERENLKSLFDVAKVCRKIPRYGRLILELGHQRQVLKLFRDPSLAKSPERQPAFPFKFLHERYLWRGPSTRDKARCLVTNFEFLKSSLSAEGLDAVITGENVLFERAKDEQAFSITLCLSAEPVHLECEMSLLFKVNGKPVFTLSFTIVPGAVVGCRTEYTIFVTRLQRLGAGDEGAAALRLVSKMLHGITPAKALLDAAQGVAQALGIGYLSGISGQLQSSYIAENDTFYVRAYDEFFEASGMSRTDGRFFHGAVPLEQKSIEEAITKASNRSRGKHRRQLRGDILASSEAALRRQLRP